MLHLLQRLCKTVSQQAHHPLPLAAALPLALTLGCRFVAAAAAAGCRYVAAAAADAAALFMLFNSKVFIIRCRQSVPHWLFPSLVITLLLHFQIIGLHSIHNSVVHKLSLQFEKKLVPSWRIAQTVINSTCQLVVVVEDVTIEREHGKSLTMILRCDIELHGPV